MEYLLAWIFALWARAILKYRELRHNRIPPLPSNAARQQAIVPRPVTTTTTAHAAAAQPQPDQQADATATQPAGLTQASLDLITLLDQQDDGRGFHSALYPLIARAASHARRGPSPAGTPPSALYGRIRGLDQTLTLCVHVSD